MTLRQIAAKFNVSVATVSKALKDSYEISSITKEKIQRFAKMHNYKPNSIALSLMNKKTNNIGVIVPTLENHFFVKVIIGIEQVAYKKGYNIVIITTNGSLKKEIESTNIFERGIIDGLLISLSEETESKKSFDHLKDFIQNAGPMVMFDRDTSTIKCDKIIVDDFNCTYHATTHLIKTGCKNIVIVSVLDNLGIIQLRINGYKQALIDNGITVNEKLIKLIKQDYDFETEIVTLLNYNPVDAILGLEEYSTVEALLIAKSRGYKIPEDISFIGFTNGNLYKYITPSISCISQHAVYIGKKAVEKLIERIEQKDEENPVFETKTIKGSLILRDSTYKLL